MSDNFAIYAKNIGKCYQIYDRPSDRLKQSLWRGKKQFYHEFWAIQNISFEIRKGETIGIIGSNGSGKSTLLQLICGILHPTDGELEVNGRVAALLELGAGFNPEFTGRENIFMNAAIMGLSRAEVNEKYDEIVAFADIGAFINQPVKRYSSGMYVRLAFATAINVSPDILVVDEALSVGDVRFQQKCMAKIRNFCKTGTVLFVSHDTTAVTELCSRVLWIESGKLRMQGQPKFVVEKYLQYMYEGDGIQESGVRSQNTSNSQHQTPNTKHINSFLPVDKTVRQFGNRKATIEAVRLSSLGNGNGVVYAGQPCSISMILFAHDHIAQPIVGYLVKDRLGREIMGDNTALMKQELAVLKKGEHYLISFELDMWPNIHEQEYSLSVAIADGSFYEHEQCHWLHDVIIFKCIPVRTPAGIFSVTNTDISLLPIGNPNDFENP